VQLDPKDPAILSLLVQRFDDFGEEFRDFGKKLDDVLAVSKRVELHEQKLDDHGKDISGQFKAIRKVEDYNNNLKGGLKVFYVVISLFSGIMITTGALMFTAYNNGAVTRQELVDLKAEVDAFIGARK
jgi:hypothetical protein